MIGVHNATVKIADFVVVHVFKVFRMEMSREALSKPEGKLEVEVLNT